MPGAVPFTSTYALTNATLKYCLKIADMGVDQALTRYPELKKGLNIHGGNCVNRAVANSLDLPFTEY